MTSPAGSRPLLSLFRLLFGLSLLAYLAAAIYVWQLNLNDTRVKLGHINSLLAQGVRTTLKGHELILQGLGHELLAKGALENPEAGRALIERLNAIDPGMAGFGLARADGQLVLVSGIQPGARLPSLAKREQTRDNFQEALEAGRLRTGRPYFFKQLGEWVVAIRVPLYGDAGELLALMTAGYRIEGGTTAWAYTDLPRGVSIAITGYDGYLRYMTPLPPSDQTGANTYEIPTVAGTLAWLQSLGPGKTFALRDFPRAGGYHYVSATRIPEYGLYTGAYIPRVKLVANWIRRLLVPTLLFDFFLLGSLLAYRHTARRQHEADAAVHELSAWQQAVLDGAEYGILSTDIDGTIVSFNNAARRMLGYRPSEVIGKTTPLLIHDPAEIEQRALELSKALDHRIEPGFDVLVALAREGRAESREWSYVRKNGSHFPVNLTISALQDEQGEINGFVGIAQELSEKRAMSASLRDSEARYAALFEHSGDATFLLREDRFIDCNPATLDIFGCTREQIVGQTPARYSPSRQADGNSSELVLKEKIDTAAAGKHQRFEWIHLRQDGTPFDAEVSLTSVTIGGQAHLLASVRDITERKRAEQKLAHQARHDSLTGLPNRSSLHERVNQALDTLSASEDNAALMLLDLNRFKEINDTLGHHVGDEVLSQIGPRLQQACGQRCTLIARLGGDEFAIFLNDPMGDTPVLAQGLIEALRQPFPVSGMEVRIGGAIGIARYPEDGGDSHELLRAADVAMYQAKKHAQAVSVYDSAFDEYTTERLALASELTDALSNDELVLHYQPKIDIGTGATVGIEALVRWQHPQRGLLQPGVFLDLVEMSEIIHPFTQAILCIAIADKRRLHALGWNQPLAINLSAHNLQDARCFSSLQAALTAHEVPATEIEIELTETALMVDPQNASELLRQFNEIGVSIYIDDFGTGYSSLDYLRRLQLQALKIDRSFVGNMIDEEANATIVRSTVALAHALQLKVVAEGVEDNATLKLLRGMGCDQAQGYAICRPRPFEQLVDWLSDN